MRLAAALFTLSFFDISTLQLQHYPTYTNTIQSIRLNQSPRP